MTQYIHRLLLIAPVSRLTALRNWLTANIDPIGGQQWFVESLSANSQAPATHGWASFSATNQQLRKIVIRLLTDAGLSLPADWDDRTRALKFQWLREQRDTIRANTGIWIAPMPNDGQWDAPEDAITAMGLQRIAAAP